jgi:hypothetical protein
MVGPTEYVTLPDAAEILGVSLRRVHQLLGDGEFIAVCDESGIRRIPAAYLQDGAVVKALPAVIRLLRDARYDDDEIVEWLARPDDSLPGTPIQALRENRGREVKRRAQVSGY